MARRTGSGFARRIALLGAGLVIVFSYAVGGYVLLGFDFVDALYMASLALTTAGFNPVADLTRAQKVFTVTIAVLGVSVFLAVLATVSEAVAGAELPERRRRRKMDKRIASLDEHFVICAYGRVGRTVAREFEAAGTPFVVIEPSTQLESDMRRDGVFYLVGDPAQERVLDAAGIKKARGLVCAMDSDAANVFITLTARSLNPYIFIVARAGEASSADRLYRAGADRVVSPYVTSGRHMAMLATRPHLVDYLEMGARDELGLRLEEVLIEPTSLLVGKRLGDVLGEAVALAVRHAGGEMVHNPEPTLELQVGDLLILMGGEEALRPFEGE